MSMYQASRNIIFYAINAIPFIPLAEVSAGESSHVDWFSNKNFKSYIASISWSL